MAGFKVRRKLKGTGGARIGSSGSYTDIGVDGNITQAGTATATFNKITLPSTGTQLQSILAGSASVTTGSLAGETSASTKITISGLSGSHKLFLTPSGSMGGNIYQGAMPGSGSADIWYKNAGSANTVDATETWYHLSIRD